jgi:hypothetical protein
MELVQHLPEHLLNNSLSHSRATREVEGGPELMADNSVLNALNGTNVDRVYVNQDNYMHWGNVSFPYN